jgi:hypothetical protein
MAVIWVLARVLDLDTSFVAHVAACRHFDLLTWQEDLTVMVAVARANGRTVQVVRLKAVQPSLELQQAVCGDRDAVGRQPPEDAMLPLLLLPPGYAIIDEERTPALLAELLLVRFLTILLAFSLQAVQRTSRIATAAKRQCE